MELPANYEDVGIPTKHIDILQKFRSKLQDVLTSGHTDADLLNWIIGNNYDLKKAERTFRMVQSFRKLYCFDTITDTYVIPEVIQKYNRSAFLGFAKDGSAIRYYSIRLDVLGFGHSLSLNEILLYFIYTMESDLKKLKEQTEKTGKYHSKITFVIDFDEFSYKDMFHKVVINSGLEFFSKYQEFYPETWSKFLIINAPYLSDKIILLFKPVLQSRLYDSIEVATKCSTGALLKNYMDEDALPVILGGTRVDSTGDPKCLELIPAYRKIPEAYYLKNTIHFIDETDPDVKVLFLRPWRVHNVPVIIKEVGAKIRAELRTENGYILFSILHRHFPSDPKSFDFPGSNDTLDPEDKSSDLQRVAPIVKSHTEIAPYDMTIHAVWTGIYIFCFQIASNWLSTGKLYYRITVLPPN